MEMFILSLQVYPGVELKVTPVRGCGGRCATEGGVEWMLVRNLVQVWKKVSHLERDVVG